jgi:hypothetical protein
LAQTTRVKISAILAGLRGGSQESMLAEAGSTDPARHGHFFQFMVELIKRYVSPRLNAARPFLIAAASALAVHQPWHIDVSYINISGTFYYLCSVLDGCSRYIVNWDLPESMTEADIEIILKAAKELQAAKEKYPEPRPRIDASGSTGTAPSLLGARLVSSETLSLVWQRATPGELLPHPQRQSRVYASGSSISDSSSDTTVIEVGQGTGALGPAGPKYRLSDRQLKVWGKLWAGTIEFGLLWQRLYP